jgi:hypothetical protein
MITIFAIFAHFRRKNKRFSQKPMLWPNFCIALFWAKNANFFADFFYENNLKIITLVPGHPDPMAQKRLFDVLPGVARFFSGTTYQNGKNIPKDHKICQMVVNVPNCHTYICQHYPFKSSPKCTQFFWYANIPSGKPGPTDGCVALCLQVGFCSIKALLVFHLRGGNYSINGATLVIIR